MIRYRLICRCDHEFDAWFSSSAAYDAQEAGGQIVCPACGGHDVTKALMAPRIATAQNAPNTPTGHDQPPTQTSGAQLPATAGAAPPASADAEKVRAIMGELRQLRDRMVANSEYVGASFAEEARKIHYEEAPERAIHGEASREDVRKLDEEGIDILPLPRLPSDLS